MRTEIFCRTKQRLSRVFHVKHAVLKAVFTGIYIARALLMYHFGIGCPFKKTFGIPCCGCGLTTAAIAALRLDFSAAFQAHCMFWAVPILYGYIWFDGKISRNKRWNNGILLCLLGGFLVRWVICLI